MDRFQAMQVFTRVVDVNSFTRAADSLSLPRTTVTTMIQNLESLLQVRLLNRTTRKVSLTPDGAAYYERCMRILADVEETEASFRNIERGPQGRLRVDVPGAIGRLILTPRLSDFRVRYPDVQLVIGMSDRLVDLVQEGVDCVIRAGHLQDSSMVARRIGSFNMVVCASPSYLDLHGEPSTIEDLQNHHVVHYFSSRTGRNFDWDFVIDGESTEIKVNGDISVNDSEAYVACGLQGLGLIQAPRFMVLRHLQSGELKDVLTQWPSSPIPISIMYLHNRHLSPKVRAFVDWVAELFGRCPLLNGRENDEGEDCPYFLQQGKNTMSALIEEENII